MGPKKAFEAFNAYVFLLVAAEDAETLFEVRLQADNDSRLTRNQQEALDAIAQNRGRLIKMEAWE